MKYDKLLLNNLSTVFQQKKDKIDKEVQAHIEKMESLLKAPLINKLMNEKNNEYEWRKN